MTQGEKPQPDEEEKEVECRKQLFLRSPQFIVSPNNNITSSMPIANNSLKAFQEL